MHLLLHGRPVQRIARDGLPIGNGAGERIAALGGFDRVGRDDAAILGPAAPFAGRILIGAAVDPDIVRESGGAGEDENDRRDKAIRY